MKNFNIKIQKLLEAHPTFPTETVKRTKQQDKETKKMIKSEDESEGLWHNINKAKKSGKVSSKWKNDPKYRKQMKDQADKIERKKK